MIIANVYAEDGTDVEAAYADALATIQKARDLLAGPVPRVEPRPEDHAMSDLMSSYWVNFAKTGDPNGPGLPPWPAFTGKNQQVMVFDAAPGARTYPALERVKVFDPYFETLRKEK